MLRQRPRHPLELGVVLNKVLHDGDDVDLPVALNFNLEVLHQYLDSLPDLAEVAVDVGGVELVLRGAERIITSVPKTQSTRPPPSPFTL